MNSPRQFVAALTALYCALAIFAAPSSCHAQLFRKSPEKLNFKIRKAGERLDAVQLDPETRIPQQVLANARGVIIIHQFKAGIGIGAQGGGGVALVKNARTGQWSPPAFVANAEGSYGWQIGAQNADTVFVIMHEEGMKILRQGGMKLGVDVRATAGPASAGGEAAVDSVKSPILVYSNQAGLFAGVAIEGGGIVPAQKNNLVYYGLSMQEVLFGDRAKLTAAGRELIAKLNAFAGGGAKKSGGVSALPNLQPYRPAAPALPGQTTQPQPAAAVDLPPQVLAPPQATRPPTTSAPKNAYPPVSEVSPAVSRNPGDGTP